MAVLAVAAAGSLVGGAIGGTFLGVTAASWGWMVGSVVGNMLFGESGDGFDYEGPRLNDSTFTGEVEGTDVPIMWGGDRVPGKPIWVKAVREQKTTTSSGGGGKGGGGGGGSSQTTYTYYQTFAVSFGEVNAPAGPRRIWLNQELVYDISGTSSNVVDVDINFSFYNLDDGNIDSIIEQDVGVGNCPSYKGRTYIIFDDLNLSERYGNRIPVVECEFQTEETSSPFIIDQEIGDWCEIKGGNCGSVNFRDYWSQKLYHPQDRGIAIVPRGSTNYVASPLMYYNTDTKQMRFLGNYGWHECWRLTWVSYQTLEWIAYGYYQPEDEPNRVWFSQRDTTNHNLDIYVFSWPEGKLTNRFVRYGMQGGGYLSQQSRDYVLVGERNLSSRACGAVSKTLVTSDALTNFTAIGITDGTFYASNIDTAYCIDYEDNIFQMIRMNHSADADVYNINVTSTDGANGMHATQESTGFFAGNTAWMLENNIDPNDNPFWQLTGYPYYDRPTNTVYVVARWLSGSGTNYDDYVLGYNPNTLLITFSHNIGNIGQAAYNKDGWNYDAQTRTIWTTITNNYLCWIELDKPKVNVRTDVTGTQGIVPYPPRNSVFHVIEDPANTMTMRETFLNQLDRGSISVATIVSNILERSGISPAEYDTSELIPYTVGGFVHGTRHPGRSDIELLLSSCNADGYHSDDKIKFKIRGGTVAATVSVDEINCIELRGPQHEEKHTSVNIPMEIEIPRELEIKYRSADNNYTTGIAHSYTAVAKSRGKKTIEMSMALTDQKASDIASQLHQQIIESIVYSFTLPIKYFNLEPTDIIEIPIDGVNHRIRLTEVTRGTNWIMECKAVIDAAENYISTAAAAGAEEYLGSIPISNSSYLIIFDTPLLRDIDSDHVGPYISAFTFGDNFPISSVYYSPDNVNYALAGVISEQPKVGFVQTAVNSALWENWVPDTIQVTFYDDSVTLSSSTKVAIEADPTINAVAYGINGRWELLNFETATLVDSSPKTYDLTNLLRGRRGTNSNYNNHAATDYLVVLDPTNTETIFRHVLLNSQFEQTIYYKLVPKGRYLADINEQAFIVEGEALKPYSPVDVTAVDNAGDIDTSWTRRTRRGGSLGGSTGVIDGVGGNIEEDDELYDIEVKDLSNNVLRSYTDRDINSWTYLAADQTIDGADALGALNFDIYQKSAVVGRGFAGRGYFDKGWGFVVNYMINSGKYNRLWPLDDVVEAGAAQERIFGNTNGTYTGVTVGPDLGGDSSGSMRCSNNAANSLDLDRAIRDATTGQNYVNIILFYLWDGYAQYLPSNKYFLATTQGGAAYRFLIGTSSLAGLRAEHAPEAGNSGTFASGSIPGQKNRNRCNMISAHFDLRGTYSSRIYLNGSQVAQAIAGTGHSTYQSWYQGQTDDPGYADRVGNHWYRSINGSPEGNISIACVAISWDTTFDRDVDGPALWNAFLANNKNLFTNYDFNNLLAWHRMDGSDVNINGSFSEGLEVGPAAVCVNNMSGRYESQTLFNTYGTYAAGTNRVVGFEDVPSSWKVQDVSFEFWIGPSGYTWSDNFPVFSISPRDYNGATKRGLVLHLSNTNGFWLRVGAGGASYEDYTEGSTRSSGTYNQYHVVISCSSTLGFKVYVNGVEVVTSSGTTHTIDWTDGGSGYPNTCNAYLGRRPSGALFSNFFSDTQYVANGFAVWNKALSAAEVTDLNKISRGA